MPHLLIVFTTYPSQESAEKASCDLITRRLAACCQISQVTSIYPWKGNVERETEYKLTIKTFTCLFNMVKKLIEESHPYEVPEIVGIEAHSASGRYSEWMELCMDVPSKGDAL
ncbi:CutA-like divalent cation tolerance protein [Encephalitozoon hellem ATCC 50504]|uniref:Periplasmic divalent cation tolerance protein CutA n=1 Tax=Encephalitozoon hellem TaxID=27973 RepID=A0A9Q9F9E6_ENCHE|nr:CutA-like divalent cation tolerance protein [Encephalitozoon hellem ATCC 50504]AFM98181.1 CutA-like divalent cation tolerance protein [Encephalitozoon hellem ATCC 50504]UTX43027.1 periplasmic divalent cation tolerance protein CutA [Encephalitozoon hellem]|eukprot:XP_003887162.1 CutA-like divalent cation tolerance protein [Encephalitozoon hellem ATCC 50504]